MKLRSRLEKLEKAVNVKRFPELDCIVLNNDEVLAYCREQLSMPHDLETQTALLKEIELLEQCKAAGTGICYE